jgi:hypothetical protein
MTANDTDRVLNDIDELVDSFITSDYTVSGDAMRSAPEPVDEHPFGPVIDAYTRADMVRDGSLVEASPSMVSEAGLCYPVAFTRAAWDDCVAWTDEDSTRKGTLQDEDGRLWDALWMTRAAINRGGRDLSEVVVDLYRVPRTGRGIQPRRTFLSAFAGPGDDGEMVITITMPDENWQD